MSLASVLAAKYVVLVKVTRKTKYASQDGRVQREFNLKSASASSRDSPVDAECLRESVVDTGENENQEHPDDDDRRSSDIRSSDG